VIGVYSKNISDGKPDEKRPGTRPMGPWGEEYRGIKISVNSFRYP
jgi:hypothetical protein